MKMDEYKHQQNLKESEVIEPKKLNLMNLAFVQYNKKSYLIFTCHDYSTENKQEIFIPCVKMSIREKNYGY